MAVVSSSDLVARDWAELRDLSGWPTLLFGNGFSMNIWRGFSYRRLYDVARLRKRARRVFGELDVSDFEFVLGALIHGEIVVRATGGRTTKLERLQQHIRKRLFDAVRAVHPQYPDMVELLPTIAQRLVEYRRLFTTNYDLLPYWSLVASASDVFTDLFLTGGDGVRLFDSARSADQSRTALYFLHGSVHLWQDEDAGWTGKWQGQHAGLLHLDAQYRISKTRRPLFVSEGSTERKLSAIKRSDYLSHALLELDRDDEDTVVFGHSLSEADRHVCNALMRRGSRHARKIAVSVREPDNFEYMARVKNLLEVDGQRVLFFLSETHPLGGPDLTVSPADRK